MGPEAKGVSGASPRAKRRKEEWADKLKQRSSRGWLRIRAQNKFNEWPLATTYPALAARRQRKYCTELARNLPFEPCISVATDAWLPRVVSRCFLGFGSLNLPKSRKLVFELVTTTAIVLQSLTARAEHACSWIRKKPNVK